MKPNIKEFPNNICSMDARQVTHSVFASSRKSTINDIVNKIAEEELNKSYCSLESIE